jgi:hypothetical protein
LISLLQWGHMTVGSAIEFSCALGNRVQLPASLTKLI